MVTMVTLGGDLEPGCLADALLAGLGQSQMSSYAMVKGSGWEICKAIQADMAGRLPMSPALKNRTSKGSGKTSSTVIQRRRSHFGY